MHQTLPYTRGDRHLDHTKEQCQLLHLYVEFIVRLSEKEQEILPLSKKTTSQITPHQCIQYYSAMYCLPLFRLTNATRQSITMHFGVIFLVTVELDHRVCSCSKQPWLPRMELTVHDTSSIFTGMTTKNLQRYNQWILV